MAEIHSFTKRLSKVEEEKQKAAAAEAEEVKTMNEVFHKQMLDTSKDILEGVINGKYISLVCAAWDVELGGFTYFSLIPPGKGYANNCIQHLGAMALASRIISDQVIQDMEFNDIGVAKE